MLDEAAGADTLERALVRETQFGTGAKLLPAAPTTTCSTPSGGR